MSPEETLDSIVSRFKDKMEYLDAITPRQERRGDRGYETRQVSFEARLTAQPEPRGKLKNPPPQVVEPPVDPCVGMCIEPYASYATLQVPYQYFSGSSDESCPVGSPCSACFDYSLGTPIDSLTVVLDAEGGCVWSHLEGASSGLNWKVSCSGGVWVLTNQVSPFNGIYVTYTRNDPDPKGVYTLSSITGCIGATSLAAIPGTITVT